LRLSRPPTWLTPSTWGRYQRGGGDPYTLTLPNICNPLTVCFQAVEKITALLHRAEYCAVYEKWLHEKCTVSCKLEFDREVAKVPKILKNLSKLKSSKEDTAQYFI
jgi:hypothetical protein